MNEKCQFWKKIQKTKMSKASLRLVRDDSTIPSLCKMIRKKDESQNHPLPCHAEFSDWGKCFQITKDCNEKFHKLTVCLLRSNYSIERVYSKNDDER